jgi:type I protein arginine methyltransferase
MTDASTSIEPGPYRPADYGGMLADRIRTETHVDALRRTVKPGSLVIDLGTGTGTFAMLACKLGARRVVAIEPDEIIDVAREVSAANGYADRIDFIQSASTDVTLAEPADVILSDLRGVLPLNRMHIPSLIDARARLLAPQGTLIPWRDSLWATVVEEPTSYWRYADVWRDAVPELDAEIVRRLVVNTWWKRRLNPDQLLAEPKLWVVLDYHTIEGPNVSGSLEWTIARAGTAHGMALWFDAELIEGVFFSGAPGKPTLVYGQAFFPFAEPLALNPGDRVATTLQASLVGRDYEFRWETIVSARGNPGRVIASFDQSTLLGMLPSLARLKRTMASHTPTLNDEGTLVQFVLGQMSEGVTLGEIAVELTAKFPKRFRTWNEGLAYAARLSTRYSL